MIRTRSQMENKPHEKVSVRGERANFTGLVLGCIEASKQTNTYVRSFSFEKKPNPSIRAQLKIRLTRFFQYWKDKTTRTIHRMLGIGR